MPKSSGKKLHETFISIYGFFHSGQGFTSIQDSSKNTIFSGYTHKLYIYNIKMFTEKTKKNVVNRSNEDKTIFLINFLRPSNKLQPLIPSKSQNGNINSSLLFFSVAYHFSIFVMCGILVWKITQHTQFRNMVDNLYILLNDIRATTVVIIVFTRAIIIINIIISLWASFCCLITNCVSEIFIKAPVLY